VDKEKIKFYIDKLGKKVKTAQDEKEAEKVQIAALEKYEGVSRLGLLTQNAGETFRD